MTQADQDMENPAPDEGGESEERELSPVEQLTIERDKLKDQLLRTAADFDNFRKRSRKDLEVAERRGREDVLRELLPVFDNLQRAIEASANASDIAAVRDGVQMVLKLFDDTATKIGLERVESVGQRFDPNLHDAFQQKESAEHEPGTIIMEYQAGYRLGEKLLRPAMVVVARRPAEPVAEPPANTEEE